VQCKRCKAAISAEDSYDYHGQTLCEDCYIYFLNPPKACDPTAVAGALTARKQQGQFGTDGLTELQKKIYQTIKEKEKITREELLAAVGIPPHELERQLAVLRHCEMIRAFKDRDRIYLTRWGA